VLQMLKNGQTVPTQDALQLRNWALRSEDALLPLEEIARRILSQEGSPNEESAAQI
jgi:hypothetical protein